MNRPSSSQAYQSKNKRFSDLSQFVEAQEMLNGTNVTPEFVAKILKLNDKGKQELNKIENYNFNIFNVKRETAGSELTTVIAHILAKENIFNEIPIVN